MPCTAAVCLLVVWLAPSLVTAEPAIVNLTTSVYQAPSKHGELKWELQQAVVPLSALRNPQEHTVKIFFEVMLEVA